MPVCNTNEAFNRSVGVRALSLNDYCQIREQGPTANRQHLPSFAIHRLTSV